MRRFPSILFYVSSIIMLLFILPCHGKDALSDAQKKTIIQEMYDRYRKELPDIPEVPAGKALEWMKRKEVIFVDTRKEAEMRVSMLPGAISGQEFLDHLETYRKRTVVAYCTIGYRSGVFSGKMLKKGIRVFNLAGGILAWVHNGGRVFDKNGPTRKIHVYGKKWNYPPEGYESVMFGLFW